MVEVFKGTTTVGVLCDGGVVLASESRATMGSFIASSSAKKIYQVDDLVGLTTAGAVGDAQSLVRMVQVEARLYKMQRGERMTVKAVTSMLANILSSRRYYPFMVQLVMGGVDRYGPRIYSLDALGGQIEEREVVATDFVQPSAGCRERIAESESPAAGIDADPGAAGEGDVAGQQGAIQGTVHLRHREGTRAGDSEAEGGVGGKGVVAASGYGAGIAEGEHSGTNGRAAGVDVRAGEVEVAGSGFGEAGEGSGFGDDG